DSQVGALGDVLRAYRRAAGLTQAALAEAAGLSERGIQNIERGARLPYASTVERLVAALKLTPAQATHFVALATRPATPRGARNGQSAAPAIPLGEWKPATALCCRIANMALLRGRLAPTVLRTVVAGCLDAVRREVERYGGTIERVDESGLAALFGVP